MTSTTTLGFPMPDDSDPVADLALAVRNLAQKIDDNVGMVACGRGTVNLAAASNGDLNIVFPVGRFIGSGVPRVVANTGNRQYYAVVVGTPTNAGATVRVQHRADSSATVAVDVDWIAVKQ